MKTYKTPLISFLMLVSLSLLVSAQALIMPEPPRRVQRFEDFEVKSINVKVIIDNFAAETIVEHVFYNPNNFIMEAQYIYILPENAVATGLSMWMNGKKVKGELLDKDKARGIYEDIVRRMKDPALLEFAGCNMFKARIYPINPRSTQKIEIRYHQELPGSSGIVEYRYPLRSDKFYKKQTCSFVFDLKLNSKKKIKSVYCPTHELDIVKKDDYSAVASLEKKNFKSNRDLQLFYTLSDKEFGLNLLTYRPDRSEDGYFMLLLSPKTDIDKDDVQPKDIVFVLDRSGSMEDDDKISQAIRALKYGVKNLNSEDRFNVITFSTEEKLFRNSLVPANKDNIQSALKFLEKTDAAGGTNIYDALDSARKMFKGKGLKAIVFLTDGLPTVGETNTDKIIKLFGNDHSDDLRVFCFGLGYDVNTKLLDSIAQENKGTSDYVKPSENIEIKVTSFFNKINYPVLTDLELDFGKVDASLLYPKSLPDLFKDTQLVVYGRYSGNGSTAVELTGEIKGKKKKFVYDASFAKESDEHEFIAYLWAARRIGHLLDEIRLNGENSELKNEIIKLSKKYGIVTPYTSYLVTEDEKIARTRRDFNGPASGANALEDAESDYSAAPSVGQYTGRAAVKESTRMKKIKGEESISEGMISDKVQHVAGKTFVMKDGIWVDSAYNENMKLKRIKFGSDEYFRFVSKNTKYSKFFALGSKLIIVIEGDAYEIYE
ncbi:MAG: VWA domain-containing protein [Acidobacteria bacterium]|nr:VWA domain-containing protein [Acidobacteriota bacterium]